MRFLVIVMLMISLAACSSAAPEPTEAPPQPPITPSHTPLPATPDRALNNPPARVPTAEATAPVVGEVPAGLLADIIAEAAARANVRPDEVEILRAAQQTWSDGSLGCAQPGQAYTQAVVNGYQVILTAAGQEYDYRAAKSGYFILCENPSAPPLPPGTPSS